MVLPSLGEGVFDAKISHWLKNVGDPIQKDDPIVEVSTDKSDIEIPSPHDGFLRSIEAPVGTQVHVRECVAILSTTATEPITITSPQHPAPVHSTQTPLPYPQPQNQKQTLCSSSPPSSSLWKDPKAALSPALRSLASSHQLDLQKVTTIPGTGKGGRITYEDLNQAVNARTITTDPSSSQHGDDYRRSMTAQMRHSTATKIHLSTFRTINFNHALTVKKTTQLTTSEPITITALMVYGVSRILHKHPLLMSYLNEHSQLTSYSEAHIGVVMAQASQLIVPTIRHAHTLCLTKIAKNLYDLRQRAQHKKLSSTELTGGTFTITNPGMFGCQSSTALIYGQQSAILSVGEITSQWQPIANAHRSYAIGEVLKCDQMRLEAQLTLGLSFDHRIIDGQEAGLFLKDLDHFFNNLS